MDRLIDLDRSQPQRGTGPLQVQPAGHAAAELNTSHSGVGPEQSQPDGQRVELGGCIKLDGKITLVISVEILTVIIND